MSPARARTRTARSGVERTNHEATAPLTLRQCPQLISFPNNKLHSTIKKKQQKWKQKWLRKLPEFVSYWLQPSLKVFKVKCLVLTQQSIT